MAKAKKNQGITVIDLYLECAKQIKAGNGKKHILITTDDEGNGYHELFFSFTADLGFLGEPWTAGMLPHGVTPEKAKKSYIALG